MSEYVNDLLGHVVAIEGLYTLAAKLKGKGWKARARENTIKEGEHYLYVDEDLFHFMTKPLVGATHLISGQLTLENPAALPAALKDLEKLSGDFEELGIKYSLKVTDEDGAKYIHTFGYVDE